MHRYTSLIVFLLLTGATAAIGSQFTPGEWYAELDKPFFNPPNWIFAPVWSALYVMMAIAAWRIWRQGGLNMAITLWTIQLILNGLWSWIFFGLHSIEVALIDIIILVVVVTMVTLTFFRRDRLAGYLMVPYLVWIAFASLLNFSLWILNPSA